MSRSYGDHVRKVFFSGASGPPQRGVARDIDVFLPASYRKTRRRYPVVYMQDGQNLADPHRAFAGAWELEAALETLASRGVEAIVVGDPEQGRGARAESHAVR